MSEKSIRKVDEVKEETVVEANKGELEVNIDKVINEPSDDPDDNYYMRLRTTTEPLIVRVKKSREIMEPSNNKILHYRMDIDQRGIVLIINNIIFPNNENTERLGATRDHENLEKLFKEMGFEVLPIRLNLKCQEMRDEIVNFAHLEKLRTAASLFVIVMSHGTDKSISGVDDKFLGTEDILDLFSSGNCPQMIKKPKIFIFQSCRGQNKQPPCDRKADVNRDNVDSNIRKQYFNQRQQSRNFSDMIVAYSTLPGYEAFRDGCNGSWYIQILCEVFMNHAYDTELLELFQMTDSRLARLSTKDRRCQTSETSIRGYDKKCYLYPGFSSETVTSGDVISLPNN